MRYDKEHLSILFGVKLRKENEKGKKKEDFEYQYYDEREIQREP